MQGMCNKLCGFCGLKTKEKEEAYLKNLKDKIIQAAQEEDTTLREQLKKGKAVMTSPPGGKWLELKEVSQ